MERYAELQYLYMWVFKVSTGGRVNQNTFNTEYVWCVGEMCLV